MSRIISVTNQKGGVGKTTTAINLSASLAEKGKKVLLVDIDPQGNATTGVGIDKNGRHKTIYDILMGEAEIEHAILPTDYKNLWVIPSTVNLAGAEVELVSQMRREYILANALHKIRKVCDFILIDCPPSLSILTINALTASQSVLVPLQCEYFALEGLSQLLYSINLVKQRLNPGLHIEGAVFTMYDARTNLSMQVVEEVKKHLDENIYKAVIPRNVRLSEAPSHGKPINVYDPSSKGAESYSLLADEVIAMEEKAENAEKRIGKRS